MVGNVVGIFQTIAVVTSFYVTVKYLREVTPYFRKASIISEVGWELQRGFLSTIPPHPHSPQRADTRYLPLQLCYLVRNFKHCDPGMPPVPVKSDESSNILDFRLRLVTENRTFELHSPDGVHSCILRATDANEAASWFNSLHSALYVLTVKALKEANNVLSPTLIGGELHHIGWLSTRKQRLNYALEVSLMQLARSVDLIFYTFHQFARTCFIRRNYQCITC